MKKDFDFDDATQKELDWEEKMAKKVELRLKVRQDVLDELETQAEQFGLSAPMFARALITRAMMKHMTSGFGDNIDSHIRADEIIHGEDDVQ